jgi:hypothetical protein
MTPGAAFSGGSQYTPLNWISFHSWVAHLIQAGILSTVSPLDVSSLSLTFDLCGMADVPSALSAKKSWNTPNSFLMAQCSGLGSQSLNSPTRAMALAPGAHSLYQIPCLPSCSPLLSP